MKWKTLQYYITADICRRSSLSKTTPKRTAIKKGPQMHRKHRDQVECGAPPQDNQYCSGSRGGEDTQIKCYEVVTYLLLLSGNCGSLLASSNPSVKCPSPFPASQRMGCVHDRFEQSALPTGRLASCSKPAESNQMAACSSL